MRRQLALLSLAVSSLVVVAFLVPLGILVRNQAENRALTRGSLFPVRCSDSCRRRIARTRRRCLARTRDGGGRCLRGTGGHFCDLPRRRGHWFTHGSICERATLTGWSGVQRHDSRGCRSSGAGVGSRFAHDRRNRRGSDIRFGRRTHPGSPDRLGDARRARRLPHPCLDGRRRSARPIESLSPICLTGCAPRSRRFVSRSKP